MSQISVVSKLPNVGTTIFSQMSALAREHQALNLSQGFPDFGCDPALLSLVEKHLRAGHNQYAPMPGIMPLREEISTLVEEIYGAYYDPETEVTVTSGATEALFCAITALVREGDEVLIIEPAYDSYDPAIRLSGGMPVSIPLEEPDYRLDWEKIKKLINQRTRCIILNSPHNPTGSILKKEDFEQLEHLIGTNDIFIISDEVYEHIIFDGEAHQSIARFPKLVERSIVVSSFGKTLHTTGWKTGYCLAPKKITKELRKVHQYVNFSTSTPFQYAISEYLQNRDHITSLAAFYQAKRDLFARLLEGSRFELVPCAGTYFQLLKYAQITDETDTEFAKRLTIEHGIASIPISVFYRIPQDNKVLRFCFAKGDETLEKAAEILHTI